MIQAQKKDEKKDANPAGGTPPPAGGGTPPPAGGGANPPASESSGGGEILGQIETAKVPADEAKA